MMADQCAQFTRQGLRVLVKLLESAVQFWGPGRISETLACTQGIQQYAPFGWRARLWVAVETQDLPRAQEGQALAVGIDDPGQLLFAPRFVLCFAVAPQPAVHRAVRRDVQRRLRGVAGKMIDQAVDQLAVSLLALKGLHS